jgi:hypothetical protein
MSSSSAAQNLTCIHPTQDEINGEVPADAIWTVSEQTRLLLYMDLNPPFALPLFRPLYHIDKWPVDVRTAYPPQHNQDSNKSDACQLAESLGCVCGLYLLSQRLYFSGT